MRLRLPAPASPAVSSVPPMSRLLALAIFTLALLPASAAAAPPTPFGHACAPKDGVRFCPTTGLADRVASFDGVPLDVDVTLPATGDGPFPTILLLHGLGGTKTSFQGTGGDKAYNDVALAQKGYAVVTPTARGFGNSCGPSVPHDGACARGWTHLADMRFEVRDLQHLVGLLVDEGVADPKAIGSTGISYGGGMSTMLAHLRDRVRNLDGSYSPWTSPGGRAISLAAAWPRWLWTNGESIFTRNGRGAWSRSPFGVVAQSYAGGIFAVPTLAGYVAPLGTDDTTADILRWKQLLDIGRFDAEGRAVLEQSYDFHGVAGMKGTPAPLLYQTGWTDALFPVPQALASYEALLKKDKKAAVAMQVGDLGHSPAANHAVDNAAFVTQGVAFLDAWLRGGGRKPAPGAVTAYTMTCPKTAPKGGGPYTATRFAKLARGTLRFGTRIPLKVTSKGASAKLAGDLNPLSGLGTDLCLPHRPDTTNKAQVSRRSPGVTLIGLPVITGRVTAKGANGQLDARVWDRNAKGAQRLITRGTYRLTPNQKGRFRFVLDGNGYRFAKGHRIVLELLGADAPTYGPSPNAFSAKVDRVQIALPVREKPSRAKGISRP
jgi:pimeloyl-ACP methyl ester carboxylesterase